MWPEPTSACTVPGTEQQVLRKIRADWNGLEYRLGTNNTGLLAWTTVPVETVPVENKNQYIATCEEHHNFFFSLSVQHRVRPARLDQNRLD
jgi:hypothetical protein